MQYPNGNGTHSMKQLIREACASDQIEQDHLTQHSNHTTSSHVHNHPSLILDTSHKKPMETTTDSTDSKKSTDKHSTGWTITRKIPPARHECPLPSCKDTFNTLKKLRRHKIAAHMYCRFHNLIFNHEDDLLRHKIQAPEHMTCPHCGEDYKSLGGLNRHRAVMHPKVQRCFCPLCLEEFRNASLLMGHIENNLCKEITWAQFMKIHMKNSLLTGLLEAQSALPCAASPNVTNPGDFPTLGAPDRGLQRVTGVAEPSNGTSFLGESRGNIYDETFIGKDDCIIDSKISEPVPYKSLELIYELPADKQDRMRYLSRVIWGENPMKRISRIINPENIPDELNPFSEKFDVLIYRIFSEGKEVFKCPHCYKKYQVADDLAGHLQSPAHHDWTAKCPWCPAKFHGAAPLVSHMEAANFRCGIKDTEVFEDALEIITSDFIRHRKEIQVVDIGSKVSIAFEHTFQGNEPRMI